MKLPRDSEPERNRTQMNADRQMVATMLTSTQVRFALLLRLAAHETHKRTLLQVFRLERLAILGRNRLRCG